MSTVKVTLAKALRLKKRLVEQIRECTRLVKDQNSIVAGNERDVSVRAKLDERDALVRKLVQTKLAIERASEPIRDKILNLGEIKDEISMYKDLDCSRGKKVGRRYLEESDVHYEAVISGAERLETIQRLEAQIDEIQGEIDAHNASATVEVPE